MRRDKTLWKLVLKELEGDKIRLSFGLCNFIERMMHQRIITHDEWERLNKLIWENGPFHQGMYFWPIKEKEPRIAFIKKLIDKK